MLICRAVILLWGTVPMIDKVIALSDVRFLPVGPAPQIGPDLEIVKAQGRVGDGLVYLAKQKGREVRLREYGPRGAVRRDEDDLLRPLLPALAGAWREGMRAFMNQARKIRTVRHPGVESLWSVLPEESAHPHAAPPGGAFLIGPPVTRTLESWLDSSGPSVSPEFVTSTARRLADALEAAHRAKVTHLDICPSTIALTQQGAVLIDFAVDNRPYMRPMGNQQGLVRPGYAPLELYDGSMSMPLDARSDIYSASAVLYHLIVGKAPPPWTDRRHNPSLPALARAPGFSTTFLNAVRRGLNIEPENRFGSASAWRAAMFVGAQPAPKLESVAPRRPSARTVVIGLGVGAATLLSVGLASEWLKSGDDSRGEFPINIADGDSHVAASDLNGADMVLGAENGASEAPVTTENELASAPPRLRGATEILATDWHRPADTGCARPLKISVSGTRLTYVREGVTFVERIDEANDTIVRATVIDINGQRAAPRQFTFQLQENGDRLMIGDETWLRC